MKPALILATVVFCALSASAQWVPTNGPFSDPASGTNLWDVNSLATYNNNVIVGSRFGLYVSNDKGTTWNYVAGMPKGQWITALSRQWGRIIGGTNPPPGSTSTYPSELYVSSDSGDTGR